MSRARRFAKAEKKLTIMRRFRIDEISSVTSPAQKGAKAVLLKRDELEDVSLAKGVAMTTPSEGHVHLLSTTWLHAAGSDDPKPIERTSGETSFADGHFHHWIRTASGIVIGEARGHTHDVAVVTKGEDAMAFDEKDKVALEAKVTKAESDVATATARAVRAEKVLALPVEQRQLFDKMDSVTQDGFLAKSAADRAAEVAKAKDSNPVVYKAANGTEFRASDDPRLVAMAKDNDTIAKQLVDERTARANEALAKRADAELQHLPGDSVAKVELLRAVDAIPAESRAKVFEILKASDAGLAKAFERAGTTGAGGPSAGSAEAQLDALAKAEMAKSGVPYVKAYDTVLHTPVGAELYAKHAEEKAASTGDRK